MERSYVRSTKGPSGPERFSPDILLIMRLGLDQPRTNALKALCMYLYARTGG